MSNRERPVTLKVMVNEDEQQFIKQKMCSAGTVNFSLYARKMLIDGYVINYDFSAIKELAREISSIMNSINQICRLAAETESIYEQDVRDIRQDYFKLRSKINERLIKIIRQTETN